MRRFALVLSVLAVACSDPVGPIEGPVAAVVFPNAMEWREDIPAPWTHYLAADGGCHVRAEMQEGWPTRYGTITIYPLVLADGEWKQTGSSYMHIATINALDKLFSPKGWTFYEGTFDAVVAVKAQNKRGQVQHVETVFRCIGGG